MRVFSDLPAGKHTFCVEYRIHDWAEPGNEGATRIMIGRRTLLACEITDTRRELDTAVLETGKELEDIRKELKALKAQFPGLRFRPMV